MPRRGAVLLGELVVAAALMAALIATLLGIATLLPRLAAADARDAELELARDLCGQWRHGVAIELTDGWHSERVDVSPGWEQLLLFAPSGLRLQTLRRQP